MVFSSHTWIFYGKTGRYRSRFFVHFYSRESELFLEIFLSPYLHGSFWELTIKSIFEPDFEGENIRFCRYPWILMTFGICTLQLDSNKRKNINGVGRHFRGNVRFVEKPCAHIILKNPIISNEAKTWSKWHFGPSWPTFAWLH